MAINLEELGITEKQLAEYVYVASQAKTLSTIANWALSDPKKAYKALDTILPAGTLHPELEGMALAICCVVGSHYRVDDSINLESYDEVMCSLAATENRLGFKLIQGGADV
jgi:hypothetical protein